MQRAKVVATALLLVVLDAACIVRPSPTHGTPRTVSCWWIARRRRVDLPWLPRPRPTKNGRHVCGGESLEPKLICSPRRWGFSQRNRVSAARLSLPVQENTALPLETSSGVPRSSSFNIFFLLLFGPSHTHSFFAALCMLPPPTKPHHRPCRGVHPLREKAEVLHVCTTSSVCWWSLGFEALTLPFLKPRTHHSQEIQIKTRFNPPNRVGTNSRIDIHNFL